MSESHNSEVSSIFDLENQLQEKLDELQWKSKKLEETQQDLSHLRQELLSKEFELEEKNRALEDSRMQLTTANQMVGWLEKEMSKVTNERIQLQINCDAALKERESLLRQTHSVKMENMTLKLKVQKLEESLAASENSKSSLEASLTGLQERFSMFHGTLQSNVAKLEKEHQLLLQSVESATQLNKRLQTAGLCNHAVYTKQKNEIKELRKELALSEQRAAKQHHQQPVSFDSSVMETQWKNKSDTKILIQQIRMDIEKSNQADQQMEAMLTEFENDY